MTGLAFAPTVDAAVAHEKVRLLARAVPSATVPNMVLAAGVVGIVSQGSPTGLQLGWFGGVTAAVLFRFGAWLLYRSGRFPSWRWAHLFIFGMALSGAAWGAGVFVAFALDQVVLQLVVTATAVCLAAGIAGTTLGSALGVQLFVVLGTAPYAVRFALEPTLLHRVMAALIAVFAVGTTGLARRNARTLTELVTLRFDLAAQRDAAERANRAKSAFLAAASHDLRQPLNAVVLFASALDGRLSQPGDQQTFARLRQALDAMSQLFDALLDISRLDAGTVVAKPRAVALQPLLERLDSQYGPQAARRGLQWSVTAAPLGVVTDPTLLETLLHNLVSNALRYTSSGYVRIGAGAAGDEVRVWVEDSGVGIPAEEHEKVFTEFYQLHNPERDREKGLGLGLAIVERLAKMLRHRVELRSAPGEGSTFTVVLRACALAEVEVAPEPEPLPGAETEGLRALVVDDQEAGRLSLRAALERWGCEVRTAEGTEGASAVLTDGWNPELLITDYRLHAGKTGVDLIADLRAHGLAAPALVVSGDVAPEGVERLGHHFMHKPLNPAKLRSFLRAVRRGALTK